MSTRHHRENIIFSVQKVENFTPKSAFLGHTLTENSLSPTLPRPLSPKAVVQFFLSNTVIQDLGPMPISTSRKKIIFSVEKVQNFTPESAFSIDFLLISWCCPWDSSVLWAFRQGAFERTANQSAQQGAGRLWRQTNDVQMGKAGQMLTGYGIPRHSRPD